MGCCVIDLGNHITVEIGANELGYPHAILRNQGIQIGFAIADQWENYDAWFVSSIFILDCYRGKKYGQWLLLALSEAVHLTTGSNKTKLTPADWFSRNQPWYRRGFSGTSFAALRVWDKFGGGPI